MVVHFSYVVVFFCRTLTALTNFMSSLSSTSHDKKKKKSFRFVVAGTVDGSTYLSTCTARIAKLGGELDAGHVHFTAGGCHRVVRACRHHTICALLTLSPDWNQLAANYLCWNLHQAQAGSPHSSIKGLRTDIVLLLQFSAIQQSEKVLSEKREF